MKSFIILKKKHYKKSWEDGGHNCEIYAVKKLDTATKKKFLDMLNRICDIRLQSLHT